MSEFLNVYKERKAREEYDRRVAVHAEANAPAQRLAEEKHHAEWASKLRADQKAVSDANLARFYGHLTNQFPGKMSPDGKTALLPGHIQRFAVNLEEEARRDPAAAFNRVVEHDTKVTDIANKWPGYVERHRLELEKSGGKLNDAQIKDLLEMGRTDPSKAARLIGHYEQMGGKPGPKSGSGFNAYIGDPFADTPANAPPGTTPVGQGQPERPGEVAGQPVVWKAPERPGEVAGQPVVWKAPREPLEPYLPNNAPERNYKYFDRALPRNDQMTLQDAQTRYEKAVDDTGMTGGMNWAAKNVPGLRELVDPNTGLRRVGRALWESVGGVAKEAGSLAPTGGAGEALETRIGQDATATLKKDREVPALTSVASYRNDYEEGDRLKALATTPRASWTPEQTALSEANPNLQGAIARKTLGNLGNLFTASPDEYERRLPFLRGDMNNPPAPTPEVKPTARPEENRIQAMARGGRIKADRRPYLVGEKGPELMVPDQNGTIIPNHKLQQLVRRGQ